MVLAPAFSGSIFQHLRSEKKSPRRASSRRGFQLSASAVQENQGTPTPLHHQPRKNQQPRDSIFESVLIHVIAQWLCWLIEVSYDSSHCNCGCVAQFGGELVMQAA